MEVSFAATTTIDCKLHSQCPFLRSKKSKQATCTLQINCKTTTMQNKQQLRYNSAGEQVENCSEAINNIS